MNWLMYVFGFYLWIWICYWIIEGGRKFIDKERCEPWQAVWNMIVVVATWTWICWRFI